MPDSPSEDYIVGLPESPPLIRPTATAADRQFAKKFSQPAKKTKLDTSTEELLPRLTNNAEVTTYFDFRSGFA